MSDAIMVGRTPRVIQRMAVPRRRGRMDRSARMAIWVGISLSLLWLTSFAIGFKVILGVLSFFGFALAIVGLRLPMLGIIGIGIICSLDALMRVYIMRGGLLRYSTFNYLLLGVILLGIPILLRLKDSQTRILQVFVAILTLQLLITPSLRDGILHLLNLISLFGLIIYFYRCRRNPHLWYVVGITIGLMSALSGLAFFFNTDGLSFSSVDERAYLDPDFRDPNYIDPNALGYVFLTGVFSLCLALAWARESMRRYIAPIVALLILNFAWIVLVGSRGTMLVGSACMLYVLVALRSNSRRFRFLAVIAVGSIVVVNMFPGYLDRSFHRVDKLLDTSYTASQRTSARSDLYVGGWRLFLKNPLGVGTGGFKKTWSKLEAYDLAESQVGSEKAAHSAWLKTLVENGFPVFLLFTAFVFSFAYVGYRQKRRGDLPLGILVTVVLTCAFAATEFTSKGIWYIAAAAIVFLHYRVDMTVVRTRRSGLSGHHHPAHAAPGT